MRPSCCYAAPVPTAQVLVFAGLKERLGRSEVEVELADGATVAHLLETLAVAHPEIAKSLTGCRVAIDQEFASADDAIPAGAELAVIPPVSGGMDATQVRGRCRLTDQPLVLAEVMARVEHQGAGGLVTFTGAVRERSRGKDIERLEYEAYGSMAVRTMDEIATGIEGDIEGVRVAIDHRIGVLGLGEVAVVIAASAPHRAEAFDACRRAIEALKQDVPIWKREVATDGASWIGQGP